MQPHGGPPPAKIGLGRSNAVVTACLLAFLLFVVVASIRGGRNAANQESRILAYGLAVLFGVPLLMLIRALPRFLAPRYVMIDTAGLGIRHGRQTQVIGWPDILAVGVGVAEAAPERAEVPLTADDAKEYIADRLTDAASEALQVSAKRQLALEIYPVDPRLANRYPRLRPYWQSAGPPGPGLPPYRWRFPLPPVVSIAQQISGALYAWSPQRWAGWIRRSWVGKD